MEKPVHCIKNMRLNRLYYNSVIPVVCGGHRLRCATQACFLLILTRVEGEGARDSRFPLTLECLLSVWTLRKVKWYTCKHQNYNTLRWCVGWKQTIIFSIQEQPLTFGAKNFQITSAPKSKNMFGICIFLWCRIIWKFLFLHHVTSYFVKKILKKPFVRAISQ